MASASCVHTLIDRRLTGPEISPRRPAPLPKPGARRYLGPAMPHDPSKPSRTFTVLDGTQPVSPPLRGAVLAIGNFDGVHLGHQALLATVREEAVRRNAAAGVVVFEPHPRAYFQPGASHFRLAQPAGQMRLFAHFGLDLALVLRFDAGLSNLTARQFAADILVARIGASHMVVGYDFNFGKGRAGTPVTMRELGAELGFGVTIVEPVGAAGTVYSSSAIRAYLSKGDVAAAADALGYRWRAAGTVTDGAKRGTGLGFPTANIALPPGTDLGHGIYAVWVHVGARHHAAAAYFGSRPQFDNGAPVLEVFLFDFAGNLYGREIEVEFVAFIRADGAFEGVEALQRQMTLDCAKAREILDRSAPDLL